MIERLWCFIKTGHKYKELSRTMIEAGTNKMFIHQCILCGSKKVSTL